jgi:hypothetical protein
VIFECFNISSNLNYSVIPSATSRYANSMAATACAISVFVPQTLEEMVFATSAAQVLDASTTLVIVAM